MIMGSTSLEGKISKERRNKLVPVRYKCEGFSLTIIGKETITKVN